MTFGDRLKYLRECKEMSQEELGKVINVKHSVVSKYERGKLEPNLETIDKLAEYFYVSTDYLLGKTDQPNLHGMEKDIPLELKELGVEFIQVTKELKESGLSPKDIREIAEIAIKFRRDNQ